MTKIKVEDKSKKADEAQAEGQDAEMAEVVDNVEDALAEESNETKAKIPETPEEMIEQQQQEIAELKDKNLRLQAEFENYRKRTFKDMNMARKYAKVDTIIPILNVFDNFDMAVMAAQTSDNMESIRVGMEMIMNEFTKAMDELGIKRIDAKGKPFDPNQHEAVSHEQSDSVPEGEVIKQWKFGYQMGDYLLRPATVVVSSGDKPAEEDDQDENKG